MSKSLEALKQIEEELYLLLPKVIRDALIQPIKQDLERLETLVKEKCIDYLCKRNQKLVKVIEILESVLDLELENSEEWGKLTYFINSNGGSTLNKETYELLKEFIKEVVDDEN